MKKLLIFVFIFFNSPMNQAKTDSFTMNGYSLKQFGDFTKNWQLVTIRYRQDTGEVRVTYANPLAWKTMQSHSIDYPDGSVFAKIGMLTKSDPAFPTSLVPSGTRRVQVMVKDKKKHKETQGWGYAIFAADGKVLAEDTVTAEKACAACHSLVPERGFVFSQVLNLSTVGSSSPGQNSGELHPPSWYDKIQFINVETTTLPKDIQQLLPTGTKTLHLMKSPINQAVFFGTLDEVRPLLAREAARSNAPALLKSESGHEFSLAFTNKSPKVPCAKGQMAIQAFHTVPNPSKPLFELQFCQDLN